MKCLTEKINSAPLISSSFTYTAVEKSVWSSSAWQRSGTLHKVSLHLSLLLSRISLIFFLHHMSLPWMSEIFITLFFFFFFFPIFAHHRPVPSFTQTMNTDCWKVPLQQLDIRTQWLQGCCFFFTFEKWLVEGEEETVVHLQNFNFEHQNCMLVVNYTSLWRTDAQFHLARAVLSTVHG